MGTVRCARDEDVYLEFGMRSEQTYAQYNRIINVLRASERLLESGDRELSRARRYEAQVQRGRPQVNRRAT